MPTPHSLLGVGAHGGAFVPALPNLVHPVLAGPFAIDTFSVRTANTQLNGVRWIIPKDGWLRDIMVCTGVSSGNVNVSLWDDSPTTRNKLFDSGSVAPSAAGWKILADPKLRVTAGQHIDAAIVVDNGTITLGRAGLAGSNVSQLPSGFLSPNGGADKLAWAATISTWPTNAVPNQLAETDLAITSTVVLLMARVSSS